jgi:7-carboxy-7-deazaguanine synthase
VYGCNLHCGLLKGGGVRPDGCDTAHTWYEQDYPRQEWAYEASADQVLAELERRMQPRLRRAGTGMVFVTGGEPLVQGSSVGPLLRGCRERGWRTQVETTAPWRRGGWAGPIAGLMTSTSPQAGHGHQPGRRPGIQADPPEGDRRTAGTGRAVWKFVAADVEDLDEIDWWIERFGLPIDNVWVMPEGTSTAGLTAHTQQLADAVLARGLNLTTRLHILVRG